MDTFGGLFYQPQVGELIPNPAGLLLLALILSPPCQRPGVGIPMLSSDPWSSPGKREVYTPQKQALDDCPACRLPEILLSEQVPAGRRREERVRDTDHPPPAVQLKSPRRS